MKGIVFIWICLLSLQSWAQRSLVPDGPFIMEKEFACESDPVQRWNSIGDAIEVSKEQQAYLMANPIYQTSFHYAEPEKMRIRVTRYLSVAENSHFSTKRSNVEYYHLTEGWMKTTEDRGGVSVLQMPPLNLKPTRIIGDYLGRDVQSLRAQQEIQFSQDFSEADHQIKRAEADGLLKIDSSGVLRATEPFVPKTFVVSNFIDWYFNCVAIDGSLTVYRGVGYHKPLTFGEISKVHEEHMNQDMDGVFVHEDYFIDQRTGKFTSKVIGISLVWDKGTDKEVVLSSYFPEMVYVMFDHCMEVKRAIVDYEHVFSDHHFKSTITEITRVGTADFNRVSLTDNDGMVRLDPLLLEVLKGESNEDLSPEVLGTLKHEGTVINGKCEGEFKFYYPDGRKKAIRHFVDGKLNGAQENYFPNGRVAAKFVSVDNQTTSLVRYHDDGAVLEQGLFKNGIMHGVWQYNLILSAKTAEIFKGNALVTSGDYGFDGSSVVSYKIEYTHSEGADCFGNTCLTRKFVR